jgi:hypothetical protein
LVLPGELGVFAGNHLLPQRRQARQVKKLNFSIFSIADLHLCAEIFSVKILGQ